MRWQDSDKRKKGDGKLRHPADARQWKKFDEQYYLEFGKDPRNIRFALSTDGMNPFGERTSTHSTWPVILTMYNLPTWLCQKRKYLLLSILIQGPKHLGIDIDVFLEPLMQEMETLWKEGSICLTVLHGRPLISELLSSPPSMITRLYLSFRDRSKVGRATRSAWMRLYHLFWKVLESQFTLDIDVSWWKDIVTIVRSSTTFLMASQNCILLQ